MASSACTSCGPGHWLSTKAPVESLADRVGGCMPKGPEEGHTLGPWVRLQFVQNGKCITVSNFSAPDDEHAVVIKSFEFGQTDGLTVRIVLHDQEGGSMDSVARHLFKDWKEAQQTAKKYEAIFQWGWAKSGCSEPIPDASSRCHYVVVTGMETSFHEGKFHIEMTATDLVKSMFEGATTEKFGSEDANWTLKQALTKLFVKAEPPNVKEFEIASLEGGQKHTAKFDPRVVDRPYSDATEGPRWYWHGEGRNKLELAREWVRKTRSDNKKGWVFQYDSTVPGGKVIMWEDTPPKCQNQDWEPWCIGTYIVNGSKDSPVIEFNPKWNWSFDHLSSVNGGTNETNVAPFTADGNTYGSQRSMGRFECTPLNRVSQPGGGARIYETAWSYLMNRYLGSDGGSEKAARFTEVANRADRRFIVTGLEANLVLIGDPVLDDPVMLFGKTVKIVFMNPYYIGYQGEEKDKEKDWLQRPTAINPVLTNTGWMIMGVTHKIELGNYTTILNLRLAMPGVDGLPCDHGGRLGMSSDGWKPC